MLVTLVRVIDSRRLWRVPRSSTERPGTAPKLGRSPKYRHIRSKLAFRSCGLGRAHQHRTRCAFYIQVPALVTCDYKRTCRYK